jgi:hypothetical protein
VVENGISIWLIQQMILYFLLDLIRGSSNKIVAVLVAMTVVIIMMVAAVIVVLVLGGLLIHRLECMLILLQVLHNGKM